MTIQELIKEYQIDDIDLIYIYSRWASCYKCPLKNKCGANKTHFECEEFLKSVLKSKNISEVKINE